MNKTIKLSLVVMLLLSVAPTNTLFAGTHVYEVVEEAFTANKTHTNPYIDVDLWVTLTGPGGAYKIPAFWDGGNVFRVRLVATKPGTWTWSTGDRTGDSGLDNKHGSFQAVAWSEAEKIANPNRRGFVKPSANARTLEYADGTPFFYTGDTWWSALTGIYAWGSDKGAAGISFQDAIALRKAQGFNGINMIACFPSDTLHGIWDEAVQGEKVAEDGSTPFEMSNPGDKDSGVDYLRINPAYWHLADRKWKHMWKNGFVPYMETVRRHEGWPRESEAERKAFTNYVRYLWARYGCYNMIFSWLHMDAGDSNVLKAWRPMVVAAHAKLRDLPYGQPRAIMCPGSSLNDWYSLSPRILDLNTVSNRGRDGTCIGWLREMFFIADPLPVINVEAYYPGWRSNTPSQGMDDGQMAQFLMYGCVLNGGALAGHAWGDVYYGGVATKPKPLVLPGNPHKNGFKRWTAASMGKLKAFILDKGHDYRILEPARDNLANPDSELLALALAPDKSQGLGFVAAGKESCDLIELTPNTNYSIQWWHIDNGGWREKTVRKTDSSGRLNMPGVPGGDKRGWAYRILRVD